jgi:hypothetical protein
MRRVEKLVLLVRHLVAGQFKRGIDRSLMQGLVVGTLRFRFRRAHAKTQRFGGLNGGRDGAEFGQQLLGDPLGLGPPFAGQNLVAKFGLEPVQQGFCQLTSFIPASGVPLHGGPAAIEHLRGPPGALGRAVAGLVERGHGLDPAEGRAAVRVHLGRKPPRPLELGSLLVVRQVEAAAEPIPVVRGRKGRDPQPGKELLERAVLPEDLLQFGVF